MSGHRKFSELRKQMSPQRRHRNEIAARRELRHLFLAELRRVSEMTQEQMAAAMGITQPTLSAPERKSDVRLSTLRRMVSAVGGELEITAKLPRGRVVLIPPTADQGRG